MSQPSTHRSATKPNPVSDAQLAAVLASASAAAVALFRRVLPAFKRDRPTAEAWRRFVQSEFLLISHGRRTARAASVGHYQYTIDVTAQALVDSELAGHVPPGVPDIGWTPQPIPGAPAVPEVGPLYYDYDATQQMLNRVFLNHLDTSAAPDIDTMTSGAIDRHVQMASRETNLQMVDADARALGWVRILGGTARHCAFCITLASRGPVYKTQQSAGFKAHDHCGCTAIPAFDRNWWPGRASSTEYAFGIYNDGADYNPDGKGSKRPSVQNLRRYLDANPHIGVPVIERPAQAG